MWKHLAAIVTASSASLAVGMAAPGCVPGFGSGGTTASDTLTIGAYSVVREAFHQAILPAFAAHWKARTGRDLRFEESYGGSGAQSRAIASGFDADIAVLSLEDDISRLVKAGLVKNSWKAGPDGGMITRSLVVVGVREGNPLGIRDWDDLTRKDVALLYPDPKTSGGARWNINAIYGAGLLRSRERTGATSPDAARELLARVQKQVVTMDASGRQSMATFDRGTGDAIVTYENELLLRRRMTGKEAPYVIPPATLLIEGPAAVVEGSVERHGNRALAEAFLSFLHGEEAQRILMDYGFRPLHSSHEPPNRPPLPPQVFTTEDLGGWDWVNREVYGSGGVWDSLFTGRGQARKGGR
ncbi:MAG: sulfate ABC transporter substrate-binding protein [Isosphaeraceae bacterium]